MVRTALFQAILRRLLYSGAILFALFYAIDVFLFFYGTVPKADLIIRSAKLASLVAMNVYGDREVDEIILEQAGATNLAMRRFILRTYRFVRFYVWIAAGYVAARTYFPEPGAIWLPTSAFFKIYLPNILALLPVFIYTITNASCLRWAPLTSTFRSHLTNILYFVDVPLVVSIAAFFWLAAGYIDWDGNDTEKTMFVDGAAAVLLFLSHAMTVCVDRYSEIVHYKMRPRGRDRGNRVFYLSVAAILILGSILFSTAAWLQYTSFEWAFSSLLAAAGFALIVHGLWAEGWRWWVFSLAIGVLYFGNALICPPLEGRFAWLPAWSVSIPWAVLGGILALTLSASFRFIPARRFWRKDLRVTYSAAPVVVLLALSAYSWSWHSLPFLRAVQYALVLDLFVHGLWFIKLAYQPGFATWYQHASRVRNAIKEALGGIWQAVQGR